MGDELYTAYLDDSLRLGADGTWWHDGKPFENQKLIDLFHRSIVWDEREKRYFLKIGKGRASFTCEDTAYFVVQLGDGSQPWTIALNDGSDEPLELRSLRLGAWGQIYCTVKSTHPARFTRATHQQLLEHACDENALLIGGERIELQRRP